MPKPTFFRLDEEKKNKIIDAGIHEFSSVPLHEASISNIIKEADIPRGSFYQYFSGKEDFFYYVLELVRKEPENRLLKIFDSCNGDIFKTFDTYFDYFSEEVLLGPYALFYKHLFLHMDYKGSNKVMMDSDENKARAEHIKSHKKDHLNIFKTMYDNMDRSRLIIDSEDDFKIFFRLISSMMFSSINEAYRMEIFSGEIEIETIKQNYHIKLNWIQYGVVKEKRGNNSHD